MKYVVYSSKNVQTTTTCNDKDDSHKCNMDWETHEAKEHIPCNFNVLKFPAPAKHSWKSWSLYIKQTQKTRKRRQEKAGKLQTLVPQRTAQGQARLKNSETPTSADKTKQKASLVRGPGKGQSRLTENLDNNCSSPTKYHRKTKQNIVAPLSPLKESPNGEPRLPPSPGYTGHPSPSTEVVSNET